MHIDKPMPIDSQPHQIAGNLSDWLTLIAKICGSIIGIGGSIIALYKGAIMTVRKIRAVWLALSQFVGLLDQINEIGQSVSVLIARQRLQAAGLRLSIWEASPEGICLDATPSFLDQIGVDRDDLVGSSLSSWVHPDDRARVLEAWQGALKGGRFHLVFRIVRPNGAIVRIESQGSAVMDAAGNPVRMIGRDQIAEES